MNVIFLLDTNVFIELRKRAPRTWEDACIQQALREGIENENFIILDVVYDEVTAQEDTLEANLLKTYQNKCHKFEENNFLQRGKVFEAYKKSIHPNTRNTEKTMSDLLSHNDAKIITHALIHKLPLVTGEKLVDYTQQTKFPESVKRVKIPNVCKELNIEVIPLDDFIYILTKEAYQSH